MTQKRTGKRAASKKTPATPPLRNRIGAEGVMADLSRIMREQAFESLDDAQAFMNRLLKEGGGLVPPSRSQAPAEQAQALIYEAWEATTDRRAAALARQALEIFPTVRMPTMCWRKQRLGQQRTPGPSISRGLMPGGALLGRPFFANTPATFGA